MRNISFAYTKEQFLNGTKDVTRRTGWTELKAGTILMAVEKSQGLKKGEKIKKLGRIEILSVRREPLHNIKDERDGCAREGFPDFGWIEFIEFFCSANKCTCDDEVTRIEFKRVK